ncbi:MAG TPA: hypothetical protein VFZ58_02095 [Candidatus Saccharimonadales bacterium]
MKQKTTYLENREQLQSPAILASDIARHWQSRYAHSKAVVICEHPHTLLKNIEKQWLRLTSQLQQKRLRTAGADEILELTYAITRMQHIAFAVCLPAQRPSAHMWLMRPHETIGELASTCRSIYVTCRTPQIEELLEHVSAHSLVIDYADNSWPAFTRSKIELEEKVYDAWNELHTFFIQHDIDISAITYSNSYNAENIDNAIDTLIDVSSSFLRHAHHFQEMLQLAEPLQLEHNAKQQYEAANLLARRVAALSPNVFGRFISQALDDETFYLQDRSLEVFRRESTKATIAYHQKAGRNNLARALERAFLEGALATS